MFVDLRVEETQHIYIESSYGVIGVETTQPFQRFSIHLNINSFTDTEFADDISNGFCPSMILLLKICLSIILIFLVVCYPIDHKQKHYFCFRRLLSGLLLTMIASARLRYFIKVYFD